MRRSPSSSIEQFYGAGYGLKTDVSYKESGNMLAGDIMVASLKAQRYDEFIAMLTFWGEGFGIEDTHGACYDEYDAERVDIEVIDALFDIQDAELWQRVMKTKFLTSEMVEELDLAERYKKLPDGAFKNEVAALLVD